MVIDVPVWNIFKKKTSLTDCGMATHVLVENDFKKMKKSGLWNRDMATGGPNHKPDRKKLLGLSDRGMVSGGLNWIKKGRCRVQWLHLNLPRSPTLSTSGLSQIWTSDEANNT